MNDEGSDDRERRLYERLDALGIAHRTAEHEATHTVAESAIVKAHLPGGHAKTLLVRDKRSLFLIVAQASARVDLRGVGRRLGSEGRLRFASEDELMVTLGVRSGSVTPFALMDEGAGRVARIVIDEALMGDEVVWLHPLRNTASTAVSPGGLVRFCDQCGHVPTVMPVAMPPVR